MASHTKSELREAAELLASSVPARAREAAARHAAEHAAMAPGRIFDGLRDAA